MLLNCRAPRRGAHAVEFSLVFPLVVFFLIALAVGSMGIFHYQQVAYLAGEAARYAAVHGGQYQKENAAAINGGTLPNVDVAYLRTNLVKANATTMDTSKLQVGVQFNMSGGSYDWDDTTDNGKRWPNSQKTIRRPALGDLPRLVYPWR